MECIECRAPLSGQQSRFCSKLCQARAANRKRLSTPEGRAHANALSRESSARITTRKRSTLPPCAFCASALPLAGRSRKFCSNACAQKDFGRRRVADGRVKAMAERDKEKRAAYQKTYKPQYRADNIEKFRAVWSERRARKRTTATERIVHGEIFERDGWTCQLCNEFVDPELQWPDARSSSLDHVLPLSRGGTHTRDNVQLAHLTCNSAKGARQTEKEFA